MPRESGQTKITCAFCGETKTSDFFADRAHGKSPYCYDCENEIFDKIEKECGLHLALYACCAAFNVPFLPLIVDKGITEESEKWLYYLDLLSQKGFEEKDGRILTFFDGGTNILKLFGRQLDDKTTASYIEAETARIKNQQGTAEQRARWGEGQLMSKTPFTTEMYNELDARYSARAAEFKGTTLSTQQQDVLIKVTKWNYMIDLLLQSGLYPYAEKLQRMVQAELASECMRKTDEKPVEAMRLDATIDALEKAGLMADEKFLTYDETMEAFYNWCTKKKYPFSKDAADQMILAMQNAALANADMPVLDDLPEEYRVDDVFGEFEEEETEQERKAKEFAGLAPLSPAKKGGDK